MYSSISHTAGCCCVCSATPRIGIVTGIRRVSHTFEAVSKISEYPHSRIQIPGTPRVDKVFRGPKGRCCCFCFVGRVMPAGGLHTQCQQAVKVTEVTTRTSLLCYGSLPFSLSRLSLLVRSPPSCSAVDSILLLACVHALGPLPGYPTTPPPPPLRFEPVGTQCTVPRAPSLAIITAYLLWLHTHTASSLSLATTTSSSFLALRAKNDAITRGARCPGPAAYSYQLMLRIYICIDV